MITARPDSIHGDMGPSETSADFLKCETRNPDMDR